MLIELIKEAITSSVTDWILIIINQLTKIYPFAEITGGWPKSSDDQNSYN